MMSDSSPPPIVSFQFGAQPETFDLLPMDVDEDNDEKEEKMFLSEHEQLVQEGVLSSSAPPSASVVPTREEAEKLENEPASPIRVEWPKDSLLKPEHFTIDEQRCIHCHKGLGYAMPMNREPKVKYLFCDNFECQNTQVIHCWACDHFTSVTEGHLVSRPGNSAYHGPSSIHSFMCKTCFADQCAMEPGLEETREMYAKYREARKENEEKERDIAELALSNSAFNPDSFTEMKKSRGPLSQPSTLYDEENMPTGLKRKRPRIKFEAEE
jgi:hypothetical protein